MEGYSRFTSRGSASIIGGAALLIMATAAPLANFSIVQKIILLRDGDAAVAAIQSSPILFGTAVFLLLLTALMDLVVAWALYIVLRPVNRDLALLGAWLRITYGAIFFCAISHLYNAQYLALHSTFIIYEKLSSFVSADLTAFNSTWNVGLFVFGIHLLIEGYLFFRSSFSHVILGILLMISGAGYLIDACVKIIVPSVSFEISMFTFPGEIVLIFWLLIKGRKLPEPES